MEHQQSGDKESSSDEESSEHSSNYSSAEYQNNKERFSGAIVSQPPLMTQSFRDLDISPQLYSSLENAEIESHHSSPRMLPMNVNRGLYLLERTIHRKCYGSHSLNTLVEDRPEDLKVNDCI